MKIAFFGSSLVSAYWNGAATYYRGIIKNLAALGHSITFYEPNAFDRQRHRDMEDPEWAKVVVFSATEAAADEALHSARTADVLIKASGVGVFDELLEKEVVTLKKDDTLVIYWDVDAPATLERIYANPSDSLKQLIPSYDLVLTYGGGERVVKAFLDLGARSCVPIYNALDPETHFPVDPEPQFMADLVFLGNRLPDREARVEQFFLEAASRLSDRKFILGGNGWGDKPMSENVRYIGHVYTRDHNSLNSSCLSVLNINRDSMARFGYSPPTRIFEAAGAAACIISDAWPGMSDFLEPGKEILLANNGLDIVTHLRELNWKKARKIGAAARRRILAHHTYMHRAEELDKLLTGTRSAK